MTAHRAAAELARRFPGVSAWRGEFTGSWWALTCDRTGRHAAVRRRAPRIAASVVRDDNEGLTRVSVTHRGSGPTLIGWDGSSYTWHSGPHRGSSLGADAERAADLIAAALGAAP